MNRVLNISEMTDAVSVPAIRGKTYSRKSLLIEAADLERTHAENNLKDSESRLRHAEDADLDEVLRSLQVELAGWRSKAQGAIDQLEREKTKRLVGSVSREGAFMLSRIILPTLHPGE